MIYVTSDLHFNHDKFFLYAPRDFKSVEEMNKYIVNRWNDTITDEDDVYILGDLMLNDNDTGMELLRSLNGKLHIIYGNHDTPTRQELYNELENVVEAGYATAFKYRHYNFYLSHYPTLCSNYDIDKPLKARVINLCGHTHTEDKFADMDKGLIYHCEMDAHNCCPVLLDDIIWDIKQYLLHQDEETCRVALPEPQSENGNQPYQPRCHKCVYTWPSCGDNDRFGGCKTYKRDPPDGGFYG
jgi:calcineurin-like phosphoesterase family protein